jgi:hypothetical protein
VLVVTHEHWDHVSGFLQAEELLNRLTIREVWLPWTEDPEDDLAGELRTKRERVLRGITIARRQLTERRSLAAIRAARRPGVDGIRAYVLGPPYSAKSLRKSNPSKRHSEVYELAADSAVDLGFLAALESLGIGQETGKQPFESWFRLTEAEAKNENFFQDFYGFSGADRRRIEDDWFAAAESLAPKLDSHTNNTSLVLAFEIAKSGRVLLFPGDAQVGSWLSWENLSWKVKEGKEIRTVTAGDLLQRTVLYKVGHHGSHNATLREKGLGLMSSNELVVMIPVNREMAKKKEWRMPYPSLFSALEEKAKGRILDVDYGIPKDRPELLMEEQWKRFIEQCDEEEDWLDYRIRV